MTPNPVSLSTPTLLNDRFLRACRKQPVDRTPLWIMRQAGRYLPEYRELRKQADFLTFCKTPELVAQATCDAATILGVDAAIIFSDILIPLEAMGLEVVFREPGGPGLPDPIRDASDLKRLSIPDPDKKMPFVAEAIQLTNERLAGFAPLIGFAGAPFTLAAYAVDGGGSKSFSKTLGWMHGSPETFGVLLDRLTETIIESLRAQVVAGAHALQLFDSWGGLLSRDDYRRHCVPRLHQIVATLRPLGVPIILYVNGSSHLLEAMNEVGADVLGVDWRLSMDEVRRRVGPGPALQGNLDPCALYAPIERIEAMVLDILRAAGPVGHILNLGHGILPDAPVEGARAMVRACHAVEHPGAPRGATGTPGVA